MRAKSLFLLFTLTLALELSVLPFSASSQVTGLSGTVTEEAGGSPVNGIEIVVRNANGSFVAFTTTDAFGDYQVEGLDPGTYFVNTAGSTGLIDEIYDDVPCPGGSCSISIGDPIPVVQDAVTAGIDFALAQGGTISGTITEDGTGAPLQGIDLDVFDAQGRFLSVSPNPFTDLNGDYVIVGLPTGTYFVEADPSSSQGYIDELYDDIPCLGCDPTTGTPIAVTAPNDTPGIDFALEPGGSISGTVTEESSGDPVTSVTVQVYNAQGRFVGSDFTTTGGYSVSGLTTGTYFARTFNSAGLVDELYDDIPCGSCDPTTGTPIAVTAPDDTPGVDFALVVSGSISGTVTEAVTGDPAELVFISAYDLQGNFLGGASTAADGTYTVDGLPPIDVYAFTSSGFAGELYDDVPCPNGLCTLSDGTPIPVVSGADTPGVDFDLERRGSIRGTVTDAATGLPLAGVIVSIFDAAGRLADVDLTRLDGRYGAFGLAPGSYFATTANFLGYEDELFEDLPCVAGMCDSTTGTPIPVLADQSTTGVDFALGEILGDATPPAATARVLVSESDDVPWHLTRPNLSGATAGVECLAASDPELESLAEDVDRLDRALQATTAAVARHGAPAVPDLQDSIFAFRTRLLGMRLTARAFDPQPASSVLPELHRLELLIENLELALAEGIAPPASAHRSATCMGSPEASAGPPPNDDCAAATIIGNGTFMGDTTAATPDGDASCGDSTGFPDIWFRYVVPADGEINVNTRGSDYDTVLSVHTGCPGTTANEIACDDSTFLDAASSVDLGFVTAGSEFWIRVSGSFSATGSVVLNVGPATGLAGTITEESSGSPLAGIPTALRNEGGFFIAFDTTGAGGGHQIAGLDPGSYFVSTNSNIGLIDEIYDDVPCTGGNCSISIGDPIAVVQDAITSGIDFALAEGGAISGTVTDASSGNPLNSTSLLIFDHQGRIVDSGFTDVDGTYSAFTGLATGDYFVWARDFGGYVDELYDDIVCLSCDPTTGTPVAVTAPAETSGIDFALDLGGSVSGSVTEESSGDPVTSVTVQVYDAQGNFVGNDFTSDGSYSVDGLADGSYFARTFNFVGLVDELYDDIFCTSCDPTTGTPIAVIAPNDTPGIDFALSEPGSISGTVTEAGTGDPIENVLIQSYDIQGNFLSSERTAADGTYTVIGLPPTGVYAVAFGVFADELYDDIACPNGVCDLGSGTSIMVLSGGDTPGVDFALEPDGFIAGRVTDVATGLPLAGVIVNIFDSAGRLVDSRQTFFDGRYTAFDLPPGDYFATTINYLGYEDALFENWSCPARSCDPTTGTPIPVLGDQVTPGVDFALTDMPAVFADGFEPGDASAWDVVVP